MSIRCYIDNSTSEFSNCLSKNKKDENKINGLVQISFNIFAVSSLFENIAPLLVIYQFYVQFYFFTKFLI